MIAGSPTRAAVAAFYDEAASHWGDVDAVSAERVEVTSRLLEGRPPRGDVLEVGCGNGAVCRRLSQWGVARVTGVDLSGVSVERACTRTPPGVEFHVADACDEALATVVAHRAPFDLVLFCDSLEHVLDMSVALRNAVKLLAPGGDLGLTFPHPELRRRVGLDGQPTDHVVDLDWLSELLGGLELSKVHEFGYGDFWPGGYTTYWACLWTKAR